MLADVRERAARVFARRPDSVGDVPKWAPWVAVGAAIGVHVWAAWGSEAPALALDEVVMLGNSRAIAGVGPPWQLSGAGFMPGLGVLLAPLWGLLDHAPAVYAVALWLTTMLALLTIWPLSRLVRRFGGSPRTSVVIAALVLIAPSRALLSNYLLAEALFLLTLVVMFLAAARWVSHPSLLSSILLGAATGAVVLAHGRGVVVAVAMGVWCIALTRRVGWTRAGIAAASGAAFSLAAYALYVWCSSQMLTADDRVASTFQLSPDATWHSAGAALTGQLWYGTLAWPLALVLGVAGVVVRLRRDPVAALIAASMVTLLALSVFRFAAPSQADRIDGWFYGRYLDSLWAVVAALGLSYAVRLRWPLATVLAVLVTAAVGAGMWLFTVPAIPVDEFWQAVHVLGVAPWLSLEAYAESVPQNWAWLSALPTVLAVLLGTLAYVRSWLLPVLTVLLTGLSVTTDDIDIDVLDGSRPYVHDPFGIEHLPEAADVGVDPSLRQGMNMVAFYAGDRALEVVRADDAAGRVEVLFAPLAARSPVGEGARQLATTEGGTIVGWVFPGTVQDRLARDGLLVDVP